MREVHVTQKEYDRLHRTDGALLLVALRIFGGMIVSFLNAFLVHSYMGWGFDFPAFYPVMFLCLGALYIVNAVLLFKKRHAFILLYLVTALVFIMASAASGGFGFLVYAGMEILVIAYLFRSKRVAVVFETRKIHIINAGPDR